MLRPNRGYTDSCATVIQTRAREDPRQAFAARDFSYARTDEFPKSRNQTLQEPQEVYGLPGAVDRGEKYRTQ